MTIGQSFEKVFSILMRYLTVFVPLTLALLLPIYYWGDLLGAGLIQLFGDTLGLFIRPLVISMLYIFILSAMLSSRFENFNQHLWFSRFNTDEIKRIYKTYIYGITSIFGITLIVVCLTLTLGENFWINWFDGFIFYEKSYKYIFELIIITTATNLILILSIVSLIHFSIKFTTLTYNIFRKFLFNFINEQPLLDNIITNEEKINSCWICDRDLNKHKMLKKLSCPCNEYFHPECIDKYLNLYNNYCRAQHKISKYEHTA
jgi:hypothetical protein